MTTANLKQSDEVRMPLTSHDVVQDRMDRLRELIPEAFCEGKIDFDRLRQALGDNIDTRRERYGLTWAGKADAIRAIQSPSVGTLVPCPEESVNFDATENLFIEGDNLEVLKLLQKSYYGKVKMIYIDPPYNTGNEFIYPDNYREGLEDYLRYSGQVNDAGVRQSTNTETSGRYHSKWLSMMYPRLFLARNLLCPSGSIWISIDDNELPNVIALCDEVFGEENAIATFVWEKRTTRENRRVFSFNHDYIVCFARDKDQFQACRNLLPLGDDVIRRYGNPDNDPRGEWQSVSLNAQGGHATKAQFYALTTPGGRVVEPPPGRCWIVTKERMEELIADNRVWFGADGNNTPRRKVFLTEAREGLTPHTLWTAEEVGTNDSAKKALISLFDDVEVYDTPKPVELIDRILHIATSANDGDIILDFFAGSGTTAHAVLALNEKDGGNRTFICVQLPESTPEDSQAKRVGFERLSDICPDRVRRVIRQLEKGRNGRLPIDGGHPQSLGLRVFKLTSSNFKIWSGDEAPKDAETLGKQLKLFADHVDRQRSQQDILFELILKAGLPLTAKIDTKTVAGQPVFSVAKGMLLICLADPITQDCLRGMIALAPQRIICLDPAFKGNDKLKTNTVLEMQTHGITFRTV